MATSPARSTPAKSPPIGRPAICRCAAPSLTNSHTASNEGEVYHLNSGLVSWAFDLTKGVVLPDSDAMRTARELYDEPAARLPPSVMRGDTLSSGTFWHGALLNQWAIDWVQYQTGGKGDFVTTAMEDTGTLQSLTFLAKAGRVDLHRVLVLRTASNYDLPPRGVTAAENLARLKLGKGYTAYLPSLEAAWRVGNTVVDELRAQLAEISRRCPIEITLPYRAVIAIELRH